MKKLTTRQIALNGVVAGLYAAITILTASFAYGNIQFRIGFNHSRRVPYTCKSSLNHFVLNLFDKVK